MTTAERYARELAALVDIGLTPEDAVQFLGGSMGANDKQVGGSHYKKGGEEHWDRAWRLKYDPFQYIITKWIERWRDKGGIEDLKKAQHALEKYIEVNTPPTPPFERTVVHGPNPLSTVTPDGRVDEAKLAAWLREVKPTGWRGFVFEGADGSGFIYTCKLCRATICVGEGVPPHSVHTHDEEPTSAYTGQD